LKVWWTIWSLFFLTRISAQTLGGNSIFNFLKLPNTPQLTALGGIHVSQPSDDIGLASYNPALLKDNMHSQMNVVFNDFYAGIKSYHVTVGYHHTNSDLNFAWGLNYFDYGNITQTDAGGNIMGKFRPTDWVMQFSASKKYLQRWNYGISMKFIFSGYGDYSSNGIALDAGILYDDSSKGFSASFLVKNLGFQLKEYNGATGDDLPFDLQAGITKRLEHAPFSFSFTAHHLHLFDLNYNDTTFNNENGFENEGGKFSFDKIFRHFVLSATVYAGDFVEIMAGYNHLRRKELNIGSSGNGLNGFSAGVGVILPKLQIRFARSHYQGNTGYNQLGLNLKLNEYFGLGKLGERIHW
jgi:hypothetical protein